MQHQSKICVSAGGAVDVWGAQCGECFKWRVIPTLEEYEEIRGRFIEDPFVCSKKPGCSCDQPADIEYNNSRLWVIDRPNIPKTPPGFRRRLAMRRDNSKFDCYYDLIEGGRRPFRATTEIAKFLDENPEYKKDMSPSDFCFSSPKVIANAIPTVIDKPIIPKTTLHPIVPKTTPHEIPESTLLSPKVIANAIPMAIENPIIPKTTPHEIPESTLLSPKVIANAIPMAIENPIIPKTTRHEIPESTLLRILQTPLHNSPKTPVHDIAKDPHGFRRRMVPRKDKSRYDTYYDLIGEGVKGKKSFRSRPEVARFLDENPEYKQNVSLSDFYFTSQKDQ